jgi:pyruvate,water dikinase
MSEKWIFDDVGEEHNDIVGKKCANLGEMRRAGIPVPPGFAISLRAYEKFMTETGATDEIREYLETFSADPDNPANIPEYDDAAKVIRGIVESKKMPDDMAPIIAKHYDELCKKIGESDVPVATRSAGTASHPGQYETFLHVTGTSEVMKNIIKVWSSTFNARSLIARARLGLRLHSDPIGIAVLQMVNARAAGVIFTLNPLNGDPSKISIGGNWGLGEAVVSGEVTNDQWLIDKVTLEIIERSVATKTAECQFDPERSEIVYKDISPERQSKPCLSDEEMLELVRQSKRIEEYFGVPQDIEWAIDQDLPFPKNVLFVQARPETIWGKKETKSVLETKTEFGEYDIFSVLKKD